MASDQTLRAIITVLDRTAEPIHQINARFAAMSAPLREIGSRIGQLAEETGIKSIGVHARQAFQQVEHLGASVLRLAGPLAALGGLASAGGLLEIAKSTAEFAEKLDISSKKTGMHTEVLAGWHYAAGLVNVDIDQLDKGFGFLNRNISDAASGKAKDVEAIFRRMGLQNTPKHLVSTADALRATAAEAKHLVDSGQIQLATNMMAKLFGAKRGQELLPLFEQGPDQINKILAGAQEAGISLTSAQTASGHKFMESYKGMEASVEGLKIAIGNELFPALTPVIEGMREWLIANREWIATKIGQEVKDLSISAKDFIKNDWPGLKKQLIEVKDAVIWIVNEVGGLKNAVLIVIGLKFAPFLLELAKVGMAVGKLVFAFGTTLVAAIGKANDAVILFNKSSMELPVLRALSVAMELYDKAKTGKEITPQNTPPSSPDFRFLSPEQQAESSSLHPPGSEGSGSWLRDRLAVLSKSMGEAAARGNVPADAGPIQTLGTAQPLSTLPGAAAAAGGASPVLGEIKATLDFKNLPPGVAVSAETRGAVSEPVVNIGRAWQGM